MEKKKSTRRGLVLAGGGAKGAYAFGVMQALEESGVAFVGVSGTSVGALNALLWSTRAFEEGEHIWKTLSFGTVYPVVIAPSSTNETYLWLRSVVHVLWNMLLATFNGVPSEAEVFMRMLIGGLSLVFFVGIPCLFYGGLGMAGLILWVYTIWDPKSEALRGFRAIAFYVAGFCYFLGILELLKKFVKFLWPTVGFFWNRLPSLEQLPHINDAGNFWVFFYIILGMIIGVPLMLFASVTIMFTGAAVMEWFETVSKSRTVFDRSPLTNTVESLLNARALTIPTWVTTGILGERPNQRHRYVLGLAGLDPIDGRGVASLIERIDSAWLPKYTELNAETIELRQQFCIASAALPFGLTTAVTIRNEEHVDGGVVDNCPVAPFLNIGVDEVYVVLLSPHNSEEDAVIEALRALRKSNALYTPTFEIICFYPKQSLGNFISGTLNFTPAYANRLLAQGRTDANKRLSELGIR